MEIKQVHTSSGVIIMEAYGYHKEKFWRVYKDGTVRAEVNKLEEAKRIAEILKNEK